MAMRRRVLAETSTEKSGLLGEESIRHVKIFLSHWVQREGENYRAGEFVSRVDRAGKVSAVGNNRHSIRPDSKNVQLFENAWDNIIKYFV